MIYVNIENALLKNALNILENPNYEDLLFEIVLFLSSELREDGVFNIKEVSLKTKNRINDSLELDLLELEKLGYIKKLKYTQYKVIKHIWE